LQVIVFKILSGSVGGMDSETGSGHPG